MQSYDLQISDNSLMIYGIRMSTSVLDTGYMELVLHLHRDMGMEGFTESGLPKKPPAQADEQQVWDYTDLNCKFDLRNGSEGSYSPRVSTCRQRLFSD